MVNSFKDFDPQLVFAEHSAGSDVSLTNAAKLSLYKKSQKSGISIDILEEVYHRGYSIWNESFAGTSEQFAFDRVNSFISGGFAQQLDKDLMEKEVWDKPNPVKKHKTLSTAKKAAAKARAKAAGRPYPNMIDNMWAARNEENEMVTMEQPYHPKDPNAAHRKQFQADKMKEIKKVLQQKEEVEFDEALSLKQKAAQHRYKNRNILVKDTSNFEEPMHKVHVTGTKNGKTETIKDTVQAKDKNAAIFAAQLKYHQQGYKVHNVKHRGIEKDLEEKYTGAEATSSDFTKPNSRFVGTEELTKVYKEMTPGESKTKKRLETIKEVVAEQVYELCEGCTCMEENWQNSKYKNPEGGLTQAGVNAYRREHPGSHLKTAVTTEPSKLKKGSKAANRRKSFCARMGGMKKRLTSAKTAHDPDSRINKALRKWHCEDVEINELSVPLGTTGKRGNISTPLVPIRMADGSIKKLPPGKSGSSGGGGSSEE
jgi:hypothetical protein